MDCTAKCRLSYHADVVLSVVTRESVEKIQHFMKYFCGKGTCVKDNHGRNAVHIAASYGRKDVLQWLLDEKKINLHEKDFECGWTGLHRACYYGYISCAILLIEHGADIYTKDFDGLSPLDLMMFDSPRCHMTNDPECGLDVYSWGQNNNFTLGHGDEKERNLPEIIDIFAGLNYVSIKQVVLCKFHAVFLANDGGIWTCGHGQGGRLGHGNENTILIPKRIEALKQEVCRTVAAGQDHTVVLSENGNVYTFGLNEHHQLGHSSINKCLAPKLVQMKYSKGKKFVGVAAGKYHSVIFTESQVYSWGLNAGQLGHNKLDKTQVVPRQISSLHFKDTLILSVTCSDVATVCLTKQGDVYLIYHFDIKKIISKLPNTSKIVVSGGCFGDFTPLNETTNAKYPPLVIYGLYGDGYVFQWTERDQCIRDCRWMAQTPLVIRDIAHGKSLHLVTDNGEVYNEVGSSNVVKKSARFSSMNQNKMKNSHVLKQDEYIGISLQRMRLLYGAKHIACDKYSLNFAVLQVKPFLGVSDKINISPSNMSCDLKSLYERRGEYHDLEIKVKKKSIFAHQVIMAQVSKTFRNYINDAKQKSSSIPIIHLGDENYDVIREILEYAYTGSCSSLPAIPHDDPDSEQCQLTDIDILNELALSLENVDLELLGTVYRDSNIDINTSRKKGKNSKEKKYINNNEMSENTKELLRLAKKYNMNDLITRIQHKSHEITKMKKRIYRRKLLEYCDVVIQSDDGVEFSCHKCILTSRLEYFAMMLNSFWIESSKEFARLKIPIHSRILKVIIEYLYTDEAPSVRDSKDLDFLSEVLSVTNQLWIIRLRELCEETLISLLSLKNVCEMLEVSIVFNASNLKHVCLEFICMNICYLFEVGGLEVLDEETLEEVSKAYRNKISSKAWRVLTPNDIHLSVPWPQMESPSKRKTSRAQRRSRTSESDVIEERNFHEENHKTIGEKKEKTKHKDGNPVTDECRTADSMTATQNKKMANSITDEMNIVENCSVVASSVEMKENVIFEGAPVDITSKDTEIKGKQPWQISRFSPPSSKLRDIMKKEQQENMSVGVKKDGKSPPAIKTRMSQKEKKKLRKSLEQKVEASCSSCSNGNEVDKTPASPTNPWNVCINNLLIKISPTRTS
ncbi:inhibitor of Bruton tyrosine kinase-like isoform X2 [Xenia sp. Carnegie-2017]|uniref:inhibitor of Bruton tyrosine kinase-like isoform X2 n=1 Tax=Xenia sp. Carnegie-2017 TaxID=2897299 RepID=UPI001F03B972|nr:inhibitor of Bruton tyrosine kinase-like isoform X2 [Xenia sp. Carnegie-2017]